MLNFTGVLAVLYSMIGLFISKASVMFLLVTHNYKFFIFLLIGLIMTFCIAPFLFKKSNSEDGI